MSSDHCRNHATSLIELIRYNRKRSSVLRTAQRCLVWRGHGKCHARKIRWTRFETRRQGKRREKGRNLFESGLGLHPEFLPKIATVSSLNFIQDVAILFALLQYFLQQSLSVHKQRYGLALEGYRTAALPRSWSRWSELTIQSRKKHMSSRRSGQASCPTLVHRRSNCIGLQGKHAAHTVLHRVPYPKVHRNRNQKIATHT